MFKRNCHYLLILCSISLITGCISNSNESSNTDTTPSQIDLKPVVTGAVDSFPVRVRLGVQWSRDTDTTRSYTLMSSLDSKPVGVVVILTEKGNRVISGNGLLKTLGAPSNLLLHLFAAQFKIPLDSSAAFPDTIPFSCIDLREAYPESAGNKIAAQYKLFFAPDSSGPELYMDIDPKEQWLEFSEKDTTYRKSLIDLFTRH